VLPQPSRRSWRRPWRAIAYVERILNGRTINRAGLLYKGQIDQASCRLLQTGAAR
jgi:hypothetical protein